LSTPAKRCVKLRVLKPSVCTAPLHPWNFQKSHFFEFGLFFLVIPKPIYGFDGTTGTTIDELVDEDQDGAFASQKIDNGKTKALKPGESLASGQLTRRTCDKAKGSSLQRCSKYVYTAGLAKHGITSGCHLVWICIVISMRILMRIDVYTIIH